MKWVTSGVGAVVVSAMTVLVAAGWTQTWQYTVGKTEERPKILGIAYVRVKVTDLEKAKAFYGGVLGLRPGIVLDGRAMQASFEVNADQRVQLVKTAPGTSGPYVSEIGLATDDVGQMRNYVLSKGLNANILRMGIDGPRYFVIQDPEKNRIAFMEKKTFGAAEETGGKGIGRKILHAGFVVKDWKAESRFYEDVLGFHLYWKGGFKDDGLDWYEIQVPDGVDWIEYMLNIPANADHKELGVQNHFSLGVRSTDEAGKILRERGQKEFDGPEIGRDGKNAIDV